MPPSPGQASNSNASDSGFMSWFSFSEAEGAQFLIYVKYGMIAIGSAALGIGGFILLFMYFDVDISESNLSHLVGLIASLAIGMSAFRAIRAAYEKGRDDAIQSGQAA